MDTRRNKLRSQEAPKQGFLSTPGKLANFFIAFALSVAFFVLIKNPKEEYDNASVEGFESEAESHSGSRHSSNSSEESSASQESGHSSQNSIRHHQAFYGAEATNRLAGNRAAQFNQGV